MLYALNLGSHRKDAMHLGSHRKLHSCTCRLVDEIAWVKMTVNRRLAKSHGYYLQHAKEVCLVGKKGRDPPGMKVGCSVSITFPL